MHLIGFYYRNLLKLSVILRYSFNYRRSVLEVLLMNRQCNSLSLRAVVCSNLSANRPCLQSRPTPITRTPPLIPLTSVYFHCCHQNRRYIVAVDKLALWCVNADPTAGNEHWTRCCSENFLLHARVEKWELVACASRDLRHCYWLTIQRIKFVSIITAKGLPAWYHLLYYWTVR